MHTNQKFFLKDIKTHSCHQCGNLRSPTLWAEVNVDSGVCDTPAQDVDKKKLHRETHVYFFESVCFIFLNSQARYRLRLRRALCLVLTTVPRIGTQY